MSKPERHVGKGSAPDQAGLRSCETLETPPHSPKPSNPPVSEGLGFDEAGIARVAANPGDALTNAGESVKLKEGRAAEPQSRRAAEPH